MGEGGGRKEVEGRRGERRRWMREEEEKKIEGIEKDRRRTWRGRKEKRSK